MGEKNLIMTGFGTSGCYIKLSKKTYEFWNKVIKKHSHHLLINYFLNFDEDGYDIDYVEEIEDFPEYAQFLKDEEGNEYHWNDYPPSLTYWDGLDCKSKLKVEDEEKEYLVSEFKTKEKEYSIPSDAEYIVQFYRTYDAYLPFTTQLDGEFKPDKLKILTTNYPVIGEVIEGIEYDGIELDCFDGTINTDGWGVKLFINN